MKKKIVKLTENDLVKIVNRVLNEQVDNRQKEIMNCFSVLGTDFTPPNECEAFMKNPNENTLVPCVTKLTTTGGTNILKMISVGKCLSEKLGVDVVKY
jgi:spore coat polysaccharide biosynthesis predicted glycosyltransferase SpsG